MRNNMKAGSKISNGVEQLMANGGQLPSLAEGFDRGESNPLDTILMANASRFTEAYFQEPLTNYALGWGRSNPEVADMLEFIAPAVQTSRRFEYAAGVNVEGYLSETDDIRAIGADFKRVEYSSTKVTSKTYNKGLTIRVDEDQIDGMPNWQFVYTDRLMRRLHLNDFRRAAVLLKAAATDGAVTWDATAGKDPDADAAAALIAGNTALGNPGLNRGIYGTTAWQKRFLSLRAQSHAGGFASSALTPSQLAALLGMDDIKISREVYATGGAALTTKGTVIDTTIGTTGIVLFYNAQAGQTQDDPSSIKRFVSNTASGGFRVYLQSVAAKLWDLTVEHYSNIVVTSSTGVRQLTVS